MAKKAIAVENQTKICPRCGNDLPLSAYNKGNGKYGHRSICRECEHKIHNTPEYRSRKREAEKIRRLNPEYVKYRNEQDKKARLKKPKHWLWVAAKFRAKKKNLEFNITEDDFDLPDKCPLLEIPMCKTPEKASDASYSCGG